MRISFVRVLIMGFLFFLIPYHAVMAETLEEQLNNLVGPKEQYKTYLSPVYLKTIETEESISPQSGDLSIAQTDYVLPGRNGLDLEFKRIYKSGISNVKDMKVGFRYGAWIDFVDSNATTSSFYEDRYNIGIGMRFSFPQMEIRKNDDGTNHKFLHTESGDIYRLKEEEKDAQKVYLPEGQTIKDVVVRENSGFHNGQSDGTSKYVMDGKDGKQTFFAEDGRLIGIRDRYGNTITFEYTELSYTVDGQTIKKKLMSRIIDTIGRVVRLEYKEDATFRVGPITNENYSAADSWKASQNPNNTDSGDLKGRFQVIMHLPGDKKIVYDKSAVLVSNSKQVIRTRLQRVFDVDDKPKYHYWYEQPDLGFTYFNGSSFGAYNRYENLVQIDYTKTNRIKRYEYNTATKTLNRGSMQYRKIFAKQELIKTGFDSGKSNFLDKFVNVTKDKLNYSYTNEPDGYGFSGYKDWDDIYKKGEYRYYTTITEMNGNKSNYTYDGVHQLLRTERTGKDHKEIATSEHDEMKLVKKKETQSYQVRGGQAVGDPVRRIENFRYDEYGNLTNYTGPEAVRDESGLPENNEHIVIYTYDYDKYHVLSSKTWKADLDTTSQILYEIDSMGNVIKETKLNTNDESKWLTFTYQYDSYGNMRQKKVQSGSQAFVTSYEYGVDADGADTKGAYLTKEAQSLDGRQIARKYAYELNTGSLTADIDAKGNRLSYEYDVLNRVVKTVQPDGTVKRYEFKEEPYANMQITYTDPMQTSHRYEYDIYGDLVKASVLQEGSWHTLKTVTYDSIGNKIKEVDANGHSVRFEYDSKYRLVKQSSYAGDTVLKGATTIEYTIGHDADTPLLMVITDEEGYKTKYYYDILDRLVLKESTPDNTEWLATGYTYNYVGQLLEETDPGQHRTQYEYDQLGRIVKKTDALGYYVDYEYSVLNKVTRQQEPGNRVTEIEYDSLGRTTLRKVLSAGSSDYVYTRYAYDDVGNLERMQQGKMTDGEDRLSSDIRYTVDAMNRVTDEYTKMDDARTGHTHTKYDSNGNKTEVIEYANKAKDMFRKFTYAYDHAGRPIGESGVLVNGVVEQGKYESENVRDFVGNIIKQRIWNGSGYDETTLAYDHRNRVMEKTEPYGIDGSKRKTTYEYDKVGRLLLESILVLGLATTSTYRYDGLGRRTQAIDSLGNIRRYVYDASGNLVKEIDPRYFDRPVGEAPGIMYEYDELNRMVNKSVYDGKAEEVLQFRVYDGRGNVVMEGDGLGYNAGSPSQSIGHAYTYDANNHRLTYTSAQAVADNRRSGMALVTKRFTYDAIGQVSTEMDAYGNTTSNSYYSNGLLKERTYPDGLSETYDYDLTGKVMTMSTDRAGHQMTVNNSIFGQPYRIEFADQTSESYRYSAKGELVEKTDRAGFATHLEYDKVGNLVAMKEFIRSNGGLDEYKLTKQRYDEANRLISKETFLLKKTKGTMQPVSETSAGDRVEMSYDKAGRLISVAGPFGRETVQAYDRAGNLISKKQKVNAGNEEVTRYMYDVLSRLVSESLLVKSSDLRNDALAGAAFDKEYPDRVLSTTKYQYEKNGQLKSKTDPRGSATVFENNYDNQLIKKIDPLMAVTSYHYDLRSNLVMEENANHVSTFYEYDSLSRLILKKALDIEGDPAVTRYLYDAVGNLVKEISPNQYDPALDTAEGIASMKGTTYTYDVMNRRTLTYAPEGYVLEALAYDAKGKVRKSVDGLRYNRDINASIGAVYEYDGLGRLVKGVDAIGHRTLYVYDVLGQVIETTDARGNKTTYRNNPDGTLAAVEYPDGGAVRYTYDKLGRAVSTQDQNNNVTTFEHNAFGQARKVTDSNGNYEEFKYDLAGNLASSRDKRGSVALFNFDLNNRLIEKRSPLERDGSGNIIYAVESFDYDVLGQVLREALMDSKDRTFLREKIYKYYDNGLLHTVSDNAGSYTAYTYDKNGNMTKQEQLQDTGISNITRFQYDVMNRLVAKIDLINESDIDGAELFNNLAELRDSEYPGKIRLVTGYQYDILGNRTKTYEPRAYAYLSSDIGNMEKYAISYEYDELNRVERVVRIHNSSEVSTTYTYDPNGNQSSVRNERGHVTSFTYDSMNHIETMTDPKGGLYSYTYDLAGNKITETNANGHTMSYAYDGLNRLATMTDTYGMIVRKNIYDASGNVIKAIDAKGMLSASSDERRYGIQYIYDLAGRLVEVIDAELAARGGGKFSQRTKYNTAGEVVEETDALGYKTTYTYDNAGRLTKVTDAQGISISYLYDKAGNKRYMIEGRGKVTQYQYGAFSLLTKVLQSGKATEYRYDLAMNTVLMVDRMGQHTRYAYDSRNERINKQVDETGDRVEYAYDALGNRISMTDESGRSTYSYDENNRLVSITKNSKSNIAYTYDAVGNVTSVTDPSGFMTTYTYDKSSRMASVTFNGKSTTYAYDENGNRASVTYPGGVKESYAYDKNNKLLALVNKKAGGDILSSYSYAYDDAGRQITKTDAYGTTTYTYDEVGRIKKVVSPGMTSLYTYDQSGNRQTLSETYVSMQPSGYTDPATGEELMYAIKKSEYLYSNTNELLKLVERMMDGSGIELLQKTTTYLYDDNGNEIRQRVEYLQPHTRDKRQMTGANPIVDDAGELISSLIEKVTSSFDGFNRLKSMEKIKGGNRVTVSYVYNGDDLRTQKIVRSSDAGYTPQVTNYLYDRQYVILETNQAEQVSVRYVRGINYVARMDASGTPSYYLFNGHGDVVQTVTETGDIQNQYDYDIFGNPILTLEIAYKNAIRYAGEFFDEESGLYYLRARYYNSYTGRFITQDSYWGEDSNPLSLNRYTYAHNNPIMFFDPTGFAAQSIDQIIKDIDKQKEIWSSEEKNAGKGVSEWTQAQKDANNKANELRAQLAQLEQGNKQVASLVKQQGKTDGEDWEKYKLSKITEQIIYKEQSGQNVSQTEIFELMMQEARVVVAQNTNRGVVDLYDYEAIYLQMEANLYKYDQNQSKGRVETLAMPMSHDKYDPYLVNPKKNSSSIIEGPKSYYVNENYIQAMRDSARYYYDTWNKKREEENRIKRETMLAQFPDSYREGLAKLLELHPNWTFETYFVDEEASWVKFINAQSRIDKNGESKSLVPGSAASLRIPNSKEQQGGWYPAKRDVVEYYADPRNFLNDKDIFQFLNLRGFDERTQIVDGIQYILKGSVLESYSDAFIQAATESDVNVYFLASKALQESSRGKSTLARGAVPEYKGFFNVYNIDAYVRRSDLNQGMTQSESINKHGALFAQKSGWSTLDEAIIGGADWIAKDYIVNQNTMYMNKFDLVFPYYEKQYVQNIGAAAEESSRYYNAYNYTGKLDEDLVFSIPVFQGMPDKPTQLPR